jgi:RNA-directed DNA polymerase
LEAVKRSASLERVMRQKIQLELALGWARTAAPGGTEARAAAPATENPAAIGPSMEAIVERDNVRKALAQVRRNKSLPLRRQGERPGSTP